MRKLQHIVKSMPPWNKKIKILIEYYIKTIF